MKSFFSLDPKLLFYGFTITFFASYGQTFFISIYNLEIRSFYNLTDGQFGLIYALGTLASSFFLISFAKFIDYVDLKYYSLFISLGLAIACFGMYVSFKSAVFLFFIIFGLRFFGQGAMSHAGETSMARYFGNDRGKAISISTFGGMIGVMLLPLIIVNLNNLIGWYNVWLVASLSILILFIPLLFVILKNQSNRHSIFSKSSENLINNKKWRTRDVFANKNFYIYLPITIATPFISTGLTFHQIFIINQKAWTLEMLANGYIFFGIFSIIGLIIGGPIVDKYKAKKIITYTLIPIYLAILILIFFDNYLFMFIYMASLGFNIGIGSPIIGSLWAEIYGLESIGTVKALLHACMVFFSAISPVIFGFMIDFGLGLLSLCILSFLIMIISTLLPILFKDIK